MGQILQRTSKCHKYQNSTNVAVNIKTSQILRKIKNNEKLKNTKKVKLQQIFKCRTFQNAANICRFIPTFLLLFSSAFLL